MERRRPTGAVLQALAALLGQPDALLAVASIVLHERIRIDAPAFRVEGICLRFGEGTGELGSGEHMACLTSSWMQQVSVCLPLLSFYSKSGNIPFKGTRAKANGRLTASVQTRAACCGLKSFTVNFHMSNCPVYF